MPPPKSATDSLVNLNFRHRRSKRLELESFQAADGHSELTPVLREAVDFYITVRRSEGRRVITETLARVAPAA